MPLADSKPGSSAPERLQSHHLIGSGLGNGTQRREITHERAPSLRHDQALLPQLAHGAMRRSLGNTDQRAQLNAREIHADQHASTPGPLAVIVRQFYECTSQPNGRRAARVIDATASRSAQLLADSSAETNRRGRKGDDKIIELLPIKDKDGDRVTTTGTHSGGPPHSIRRRQLPHQVTRNAHRKKCFPALIETCGDLDASGEDEEDVRVRVTLYDQAFISTKEPSLPSADEVSQRGLGEPCEKTRRSPVEPMTSRHLPPVELVHNALPADH
jgi:hypothetical protein